MLPYKLPLALSAAMFGAYAMPLSTNQVLLVGQAVFGIGVCFALFLLLLRSAEQRGDEQDEQAEPASRRTRAQRVPPGSLR